MRVWTIVLILLLVPVVMASQEAEDLFASETVGIELTISSDLELKSKTGRTPTAEYVQADLFFYPKPGATQRLLKFITNPQAQKGDDFIRYTWNNPEKNMRYEATSTIEIKNQFPKVLQKIPFPIKRVPSDVRKYLSSSDHIDSGNAAIITQANKLAQGKDDLFIVVSDIAIWTKNNIEYNLSTLTAEVSQKASWVLDKRFGVCDELTNLFIGMLRALGIPARFITGVSYTASPLFPDRWGAHGWAEVYFPGVGWIPFDPTFGEFGWIDPGHVKMMTSVDSELPSVKFEWRSSNADLKFTEPSIDARITSVGQKIAPFVEISAKSLYDETGFGSYNLVQTTIRNLHPYYQATEIRLARVNEMDVLEPHDRQVVLKPNEKKTIFWRVKVKPELRERFVYTIPIGVYTIRNDSVRSSFKAKSQGSVHTKAEITRIMNKLSEEDEQVLSQNLDVYCETDKNKLYPNEKALITCTLHNIGTTALKSIKVCVEEAQCKAIDVGIGQKRKLEFSQSFTTPGTTTIFVEATGIDLSKKLPLTFVMHDIPVIDVIDLHHPESVKYGESFPIVFSLKPMSQSVPKNVKVTVRAPGGGSIFEMPELPSEQAFEVEMHSKELLLGKTKITITVEYEDDKGKKLTSIINTYVELTDAPFFARMWLWVRGIFE